MSYEDKTRRSKGLFERSRRLVPGGVCHSLRFFPPYPFFVEGARGSRLVDVDGNSYIDYWMGHYAHIFGHRDPGVVEAVTSFIRERGYHFGLVNREQVKLAELVVELVPSAEAVRFCSSGTEAAMYAVRLARAFTGRRVILKAAGGWHGASTDLSYGISWPYDVPESVGIPDAEDAGVRLFPFNDLEGTLEAIDEVSSDLAALIVEPVMGVGGFVPADRDYLSRVKEELERVGALLIFDEVISGFRVARGGYQEVAGILPHLTVLGKVMGGGFPIGAVAGRREILELASHERKKPDRVLMGGGTFSCNPVSMVAGISVLERVVEMGGSLYDELEQKGRMLRSMIEEAGKRAGLTVETTGIGSLFMIHIKKEDVPLRGPEDICLYTHWEIKDTSFRQFLARHGVHMIHAGGAVSTAHTQEDLEATAFVVSKFFEVFEP